MTHLAVSKTYKLFIGGAFPRSESGRTYQARDSKGNFMANAALASRKDVRDAVVAARKGYATWSKATAYNRGQVIYRIAEMLEGRRTECVELIMISSGASAKVATAEVEAAIDRLVHYAGWTDKLAAVLGSSNPVSSPYFSYSAPEPTGVVGILAPTGSPLLGLGLGDRTSDHWGQCMRRDRCRRGSLRSDHVCGNRRDFRCTGRGDQHPDRKGQRTGSTPRCSCGRQCARSHRRQCRATGVSGAGCC